METKTFVNGFESWSETHYEISTKINRLVQDDETCPLLLMDIENDKGQGGLYELSTSLTDEFETLHQGVEWEGGSENDYYDTLEGFLAMKFNV